MDIVRHLVVTTTAVLAISLGPMAAAQHDGHASGNIRTESATPS